MRSMAGEDFQAPRRLVHEKVTRRVDAFAIASDREPPMRRADAELRHGRLRVRGGAWKGPIFVLTHHPEDATPADDVTFLNCDVAEAVRIGLEAAGGKNLEVFSPTIGRQLLELGLIDEIDLHVAPILLGEGIRLYDNPGSDPIRLHRVHEGDPTQVINVRYRPATPRTS